MPILPSFTSILHCFTIDIALPGWHIIVLGKIRIMELLDVLKMERIYFFLSSFFIVLFISSCGKSDLNIKKEVEEVKEKKQHEYGGWYCPDNIKMFPAVNIDEMDMVPVINGRLPTKEETRNGSSLMYFDAIKYPDARPMNINLPALAKFYNNSTKKRELVVVIQAVISDQDTVAGFRFLNGGNGSSWYRELDFLTDKEIDNIGSTPFVKLNTEIMAQPEKIWNVLTNPDNAKNLGKAFGNDYFLESDWTKKSKVYVRNDSDNVVKVGHITAHWKPFYIQIDYNQLGKQYVEKFILFENEDKTGVDFQVVAGPFGDDFEQKEKAWKEWTRILEELTIIQD